MLLFRETLFSSSSSSDVPIFFFVVVVEVLLSCSLRGERHLDLDEKAPAQWCDYDDPTGQLHGPRPPLEWASWLCCHECSKTDKSRMQRRSQSKLGVAAPKVTKCKSRARRHNVRHKRGGSLVDLFRPHKVVKDDVDQQSPVIVRWTHGRITRELHL